MLLAAVAIERQALLEEALRTLVLTLGQREGAQQEMRVGGLTGVTNGAKQAQRFGPKRLGLLVPPGVGCLPGQQKQRPGEDVSVLKGVCDGAAVLSKGTRGSGVAGEHRGVGETEQRRGLAEAVVGCPRQRKRLLVVPR